METIQRGRGIDTSNLWTEEAFRKELVEIQELEDKKARVLRRTTHRRGGHSETRSQSETNGRRHSETKHSELKKTIRHQPASTQQHGGEEYGAIGTKTIVEVGSSELGCSSGKSPEVTPKTINKSSSSGAIGCGAENLSFKRSGEKDMNPTLLRKKSVVWLEKLDNFDLPARNLAPVRDSRPRASGVYRDQKKSEMYPRY